MSDQELEYQVFALSMQKEGAIDYFIEHLPVEVIRDSGKGHAEFYTALIECYHKTGSNPIDPVVFRSWLESETDLHEALGGDEGTDAYMGLIRDVKPSTPQAVTGILRYRYNKKTQANLAEELHEAVQQKDHSDEYIDRVNHLADRIRQLNQSGVDPLKTVFDGERIADAAEGLWDLPSFLPTQFKSLNRAMGYCVDPETEILTREGWVTYDKLRPGVTEIVAYDIKSDSLRRETLRDIYVDTEYVGPMVRMKNTRFSAFATPNHRWAIKRRRGGRDTVLTMDLPNEGSILRHADLDSNSEVYSDAFVKLCAWYFTEGNLVKDTYLSITQSPTKNPAFVQDIDECIKAFAGDIVDNGSKVACAMCSEPVANGPLCRRHYSQWYYRNVTHLGAEVEGVFKAPKFEINVNRYSYENKSLIAWLLSGEKVRDITRCIEGAQKIPSTEFIGNLSGRQAKLFVKTAHDGDGAKGTNQFTQYNVHRMDAFMHIAVLAGFAVSTDKTGYTCSFNNVNADLGKIPQVYEDYFGTIWCPITSSGYWVARRDGKVYITGNSDKSGFMKGAVHAILAASGKGKSTFAKNLMNFWVDNGNTVMYLNYEEARAHWERILFTQITKQNVYRGDEISELQKRHYTEIFKQKMLDWNGRFLVKHDPETPYYEDMEIWVRDVANRNGNPDVLIIDTIQSLFLKGSGKSLPRWGQYEEMMVRLEKLAKDLDCVIIITAQENRDRIKEKREVVQQSDIGGSLAIAQKSSITIFITDAQSNMGDDSIEENIMQLQIPKNRITGVAFMMDPPLVRYHDESKSYEELELPPATNYEPNVLTLDEIGSPY